MASPGKSASTEAASIVAKVSRDRFMQRAVERHPGWAFGTHMGYSTPEHRAAIMRTPVQRWYAEELFARREAAAEAQTDRGGVALEVHIRRMRRCQHCRYAVCY